MAESPSQPPPPLAIKITSHDFSDESFSSNDDEAPPVVVEELAEENDKDTAMDTSVIGEVPAGQPDEGALENRSDLFSDDDYESDISENSEGSALGEGFSSADDDFDSGGEDSISHYSAALRRMIEDAEGGSKNGEVGKNEMGEAQEAAIRAEFLLSTDRREVSFFCYLIIDPTLIYNASTCSLREFIESIFYVGKGNRSRPLQHLVDAHRFRTKAEDPTYQLSAKLKRILRLWDAGHGVISLHISHNIHSAEAFVREAAMIESIGLENLTNVKRGNLKGIACTWTKKQLSEFGSLLLRKAHIVFQNERCRPVFEADIEGLAAKIEEQIRRGSLRPNSSA